MAYETEEQIKEALEKLKELSADRNLVRMMQEQQMLELDEMTWREEYKERGLEEGRAQGLEEGKAQGLKEGRAEGRAEGHAEGHAEGLEEGKKQKEKQVVINLKKKGFSISEIVGIADLTEEEVNEIIKSIE